jgi:hypothetical protein
MLPVCGPISWLFAMHWAVNPSQPQKKSIPSETSQGQVKARLRQGLSYVKVNVGESNCHCVSCHTRTPESTPKCLVPKCPKFAIFIRTILPKFYPIFGPGLSKSQFYPNPRSGVAQCQNNFFLSKLQLRIFWALRSIFFACTRPYISDNSSKGWLTALNANYIWPCGVVVMLLTEPANISARSPLATVFYPNPISTLASNFQILFEVVALTIRSKSSVFIRPDLLNLVQKSSIFIRIWISMLGGCTFRGPAILI